jgi:hypothetical protein
VTLIDAGQIGAVVGSVTLITVLKVLAMKVFGKIGAIVFGVISAVVIIVFNSVYGGICEKMTQLGTFDAAPLTAGENWRTETEHEDSMIGKDFAFRFVNAFFSLFFVAFVQNAIRLFGVDMHCPAFNCMPLLATQLSTVFVTQIFVGQATKLFVPSPTTRRADANRQIKKKLKQYLDKRKASKGGAVNKQIRPEEEQAHMEVYEGVYGDYNEMGAAAAPYF